MGFVAPTPQHFAALAAEPGAQQVNAVLRRWLTPLDRHAGLICWQSSSYTGIITASADWSMLVPGFPDVGTSRLWARAALAPIDQDQTGTAAAPYQIIQKMQTELCESGQKTHCSINEWRHMQCWCAPWRSPLSRLHAAQQVAKTRLCTSSRCSLPQWSQHPSSSSSS